jgi:NAD-dependent dihydropyrimidine dehydrogenase PreA subunit
MMSSRVQEIRSDAVVIRDASGRDRSLANDAVFTMIGREPPLDFFRRSGVRIRGEWRATTWIGFVLFALFCTFVYHWKSGKGIPVNAWFKQRGWFPFNVPAWFAHLGERSAGWADSPGNLLHIVRESSGQPGFYYSAAYCVLVVVFGVRRVQRRNTPYVKWQTLVLAAIQILPLFLLPQILLPWAGQNGWFDGGVLGGTADQLFPQVSYGYGREYWRAYGFILAWPLFIYNVFTDEPLWAWLLISGLQIFVLLPVVIYYWGKGAYCGWICSCGALAETMGDAHRHKMPHGSFWNRLNVAGQVILGVALLMLGLRVLGWVWPDSAFGGIFRAMLGGVPFLNYEWLVDLLLAGIVGVACYFWFSGRVWCRFFCPLAALMHVYARFSRFGILADKDKCISCNVCTSVCHQGIDIMNFANKGLPMSDPQCVRCSACVQMCPTAVLAFGQVDRTSGRVVKTDPPWLAASTVQLAEMARGGDLDGDGR